MNLSIKGKEVMFTHWEHGNIPYNDHIIKSIFKNCVICALLNREVSTSSFFVYPWQQNSIAWAARIGVLTKPSRSGSSPTHYRERDPRTDYLQNGFKCIGHDCQFFFIFAVVNSNNWRERFWEETKAKVVYRFDYAHHLNTPLWVQQKSFWPCSMTFQKQVIGTEKLWCSLIGPIRSVGSFLSAAKIYDIYTNGVHRKGVWRSSQHDWAP